MRLLQILFFLPSLSFAQLASYNIDPKGVTISGISSGAFMAVQMQVAFSSTISGSGVVAGGPYWCAQGDTNLALANCMNHPENLKVANLVAETRRLSAAGEIDPVSAMARQNIYIFASPADTVVNHVSGDKLQEFMSAFLPSSHMTVDHSVKAAHGFPTLSNGGPCGVPMSPWILRCNHDTAGLIFETVYGSLGTRGVFDPTHLIKFSQFDFGSDKTPLYPYGWVYVPQDCATGAQCKLHVALHGCEMTPEDIQDRFPTLSGYAEWAETNRIIVLFPQSAKVKDVNPLGCWDIFGFTGKNYVTKSGSQMVALKKMIDRLMGK